MPENLEDFVSAQAAEYGTYVATEPIFYNGARAFNPGDAVPVSHVKEYGYDKAKLVEKVSADKPAAASNTDKKD